MSRLPTVLVDVVDSGWSELPTWNWTIHHEPWWRWYWNDRPGWVAYRGADPYPLGPDRIVLIPHDTTFVGKGSSHARHLFFHFIVGPPFHRIVGKVYVVPVDRALAQHVRRCVNFFEQDDGTSKALAAQLLCSAALLEIGPGQLVDERILDATGYMNDHCAEDLDNVTLGERVGLNPDSFIRLFKRELGATPRAWLMQRRIEKACSLLRYSSLSVEEIAEQLGFCDRYYFGRMFRRYRGCAPSVFRHQGFRASVRSP